MNKAFARRLSQAKTRLTEPRVSQRSLAIALAALFFLSLIPLLLIALYNYPADDDFGFTLPAAICFRSTS